MGKQVAVLIDGDNISYKYAEYIKREAMHYGNVRIFRLYGSISSPSVRPWYKVMPLQGIMPDAAYHFMPTEKVWQIRR